MTELKSQEIFRRISQYVWYHCSKCLILSYFRPAVCSAYRMLSIKSDLSWLLTLLAKLTRLPPLTYAWLVVSLMRYFGFTGSFDPLTARWWELFCSCLLEGSPLVIDSTRTKMQILSILCLFQTAPVTRVCSFYSDNGLVWSY